MYLSNLQIETFNHSLYHFPSLSFSTKVDIIRYLKNDPSSRRRSILVRILQNTLIHQLRPPDYLPCELQNGHLGQQLQDRNRSVHFAKEPVTHLHRNGGIDSVLRDGARGADILGGNHQERSDLDNDDFRDLGRHVIDGRGVTEEIAGPAGNAVAVVAILLCVPGLEGHAVEVGEHGVRHGGLGAFALPRAETGDGLAALVLAQGREDGGFEHGHEFAFLDGCEALFVQGVFEVLVFGDVADFIDDAEIEADGWKAVEVAVFGKGVQ